MATTFYEDTMERRRMLPMSLGLSSPSGVLTQNVQPGQMLPQTFFSQAQRLREEQNRLEDMQPDMAALEQLMQQRVQSGENAMLNALAAQYAGESFQPVQAQYLKRSAAAQEPMKLTGGMIAPGGKFVADPFFNQERRAARLGREASEAEAMGVRLQDAEARRAEAQRQSQINEELRRQGLNIQQQNLELRRDRGKDPTKTYRMEDTLRQDFEKLTKDLREEVSATDKIRQIVAATPPNSRPDAITQQSLVILLNKFLDPGSVVREGEFDRVVKAQGLIGQAQNLSNRILKGEPLNDESIKQINNLATMYNNAAQSKLRAIAKQTSDIAIKRGLDVESVISDPTLRGGSRKTVKFDDMP